jgi:bacterioferritin-associated ferredoxin
LTRGEFEFKFQFQREQMIVCICRRVSDKTIRAAIQDGAQSVQEIALATRAGTGCGCCQPYIAEMIQEACAGTCADCPRKRSTVVSSPYQALVGESAA